MKRTTIMLEDSIYNRIKELSKRKRMSIQDLLTDLLIHFWNLHCHAVQTTQTK